MNERNQLQDILGEEAVFLIPQPISIVLPLTYGIHLLKGIMLKGHGLEELLLEFGVATIF
ncbi:MAG: hypothetical protein ACFFGZ_00025 [Candidatus Thorarchaeota archaeon]